MTCFTDNPLERMMTQIPRTLPKKSPAVPPKGHPCHGCKRLGVGGVLPGHGGIALSPAL